MRWQVVEKRRKDERKYKQTKSNWNILLVILMAVFVMVIDTTAMNVSIENVVKDLNTNVSTVKGVMSLYTLVMASCMLLGAKLSDIIGKKKAFIYGLLIYCVGTLTAALSANIIMLAIGWPVIEGIAAAIMMPAVLSILISNYEGRDRAKAMSIYATVAAVALAVGPIIGGAVTTYLSWRVIFGGEVMVAIIALVFSGVIPKDFIVKENRPKIDFVGFLFSASGLFLIVLGLLTAQDYGWFYAKQPFEIGGVTLSLFGLSASFIMILFGIAFLFMLLMWLRKRVKNNKAVLFHPQIFSNRIFSPAIFVYLFGQMTFSGIMFCMPVFMQNALGYNAFNTGISLMPLSIALLISSLFVTRLIYRFSPKIMLIAGLISLLTGITLMRMPFWGNFTDISGSSFISAFLFIGFGVGIAFSVAYNLALSNVNIEWKNEGSGLLTTFQNLGASASVAVLGTVLFSSVFGYIAQGILDSSILNTTDMTKNEIRELLIQNVETFKEVVEPKIASIVTNAMSMSMDLVGIVLTVIVSIGLLLAVFILPNVKLKE